MYSTINSAVVFGIEGLCIEIEVSVSKGLPAYQIVGLPDKTIRESKERIRSAVEALGISFPAKRITLNLIPAEVPKDGSHLDLPMAVGVLGAVGEVDVEMLHHIALFGEMTLDGRLMPVPGILSMVDAVMKKGIKHVIVPNEMKEEVGMHKGVLCFGASSLSDVLEVLKAKDPLRHFSVSEPVVEERKLVSHVADFEDVLGQELAKRALVIAASGFHNLIMSGPPGSGKSMMMHAFENIVPQMTIEDAVEVRKMNSLTGQPQSKELSLMRPFRKPHHHITPVAMIGGGSKPRPGELTLAHLGVLFLDELPEFKREVIESLRQPLEDQCVRLSRLHLKVQMPAKILLVATMNPCKCGYLYSTDKVCSCSDREVSNYLGKLSGPMIDRIDLLIEVQSVNKKDVDAKGLSTKAMKGLVEKAYITQSERFKGESYKFNSEILAKDFHKYCPMTKEASLLHSQSAHSFKFSKRVQDKLIRIARTIADIEGANCIDVPHLAEAIQYRLSESRLRGE